MVRQRIEQVIQNLGRPVFTTREIALLRGGTLSATSHDLKRLADSDRIQRVTRGLWCVASDPRFSRFHLVPYLAGRHRAYVSFLSALHFHGLIAQIPQIAFAATTGPTRLKKTTIGTYSFHRIAPNFFAGFNWYRGGQDFLIADPEKALVDTFYLSSRKGRRFGFLPEVDVTQLSFRRAMGWAKKIPDRRIRRYVVNRLEGLMKKERRRAKTAPRQGAIKVIR